MRKHPRKVCYAAQAKDPMEPREDLVPMLRIGAAGRSTRGHGDLQLPSKAAKRHRHDGSYNALPREDRCLERYAICNPLSINLTYTLNCLGFFGSSTLAV